MRYLTSARSDVGCVRKNNEDSFLSEPERGLFIVCDGMGGHAAGEVASALAVKTISEELFKVEDQRIRFANDDSDELSAELMKAVEEAVMTAGRAIYAQARSSPEQAGMGTTCSLIVLSGRKGILAHVGDSRVYVVRNKALYQLSEDHTYVAEQVRRGAMTRAQAAKSKKGNVLTRALGPVESMQVDMMLFDVDPNDRFLLCSDGLHNHFKDSTELLRLLMEGTPEACVGRAIEIAKDRGGEDNITTIVVEAQDSNEVDEAETAAARIAVLKKIPLFQHMSYAELVKLIGLMQVMHTQPGDIIINEDQREDRLFVSLAGDLEVSKGGKRIVDLPAGSHVGEMAMIDSAPRSATVSCKNECNLLVMDRTHFHEVIRKEPVLGTKLLWAFTQELSKRLRETNESLKQALTQAAPEEEVVVPFVDLGDE